MHEKNTVQTNNMHFRPNLVGAWVKKASYNFIRLNGGVLYRYPPPT